MTTGTCLGYTIRSDLSFRFLRPGKGDRELSVVEWMPSTDPASQAELLVRWQPRPNRPFHGAVHRTADDRLVVETSDAGWFRIDTDSGVVEVDAGAEPIAREVRLWTTPMLLLATISGGTPLHAACVAVGGGAIAVCAPGGGGKTTLAAELAGRGHRLLAEDITISDGDPPVTRAGPDLLRLRRPSLGRVSLGNDAEVVAETDDRLFINTGSPDAAPAPLKAVVFLKEGESPSITRRTDTARLADLWQVSFHLPSFEDRNRSFSAVAALADAVPIYDLSRPLRWDCLAPSADLVESVA
ncbi:MAG: hypothetical protein ACRDVD_00920 [Acidimicrobiia bacterium]